jgi:hypothetical protein
VVKRILVGFVTCLMLVSPLTYQATADSVPAEQFVGTPPADVRSVPHYGFSANGFGPFSVNFNYLFGKVSDGLEIGVSKVTEVGLCKAITDRLCAQASMVKYRAIFGFCDDVIKVDCIEEVSVIGKDALPVKFDQGETYLGSNQESYSGNPEIGLPSGRSAPIISIPTLAHSGGDKYLLVVTAEGIRLPGQIQFEAPAIKASIYGIKIDPRPIYPPGAQIDKKFYNTLNLGVDGFSNPNVSCPIYGSNGCAQRYPLPLDIQFGLKIKLSKPIKGWLHGRIGSVKSEMSIDDKGSQQISVKGTPLVLPTIYSWVRKAEAPLSIQDFYNKMQKPIGGSGYGCLDALGENNPMCGARPAELWVSTMRESQPDIASMDEFLAWLPHLSDRATSAPTIWSFASMEFNSADSYCYTKTSGLSGFVATNASQYLSGPPVFNKQDQTLDYKVAAPHFLPNGTEFLGTYDLAINSEVARCLYGFTDAPITASISITSTDGLAKIETTELSQKNGWLNFSAKGFTFSSPTLKVKLTQVAESTPIATPTPTPSAAATTQALAEPKKIIAAKKTITCRKGKTSKKITGLTPKCPSGYKKV